MEQETTIQQTQNPQPVEYAGFWRRFVAYIIDSLIVGFVQQLLILPFLGIIGISFASIGAWDFDDPAYFDEPEGFAWIVAIIGAYFTIIVLSVVLQWLYFSLMESSKYQGTLGKIALNIKVTNYRGERISFLKATGRYFSKIISGLIFLIGYIMAGFTEKKQALHDMIAETYVIKKLNS